MQSGLEEAALSKSNLIKCTGVSSGGAEPWLSKEALPRGWHKDQVPTAAAGMCGGEVCAGPPGPPEPPTSPWWPPRMEEVAAPPSCPQGWSKV